MHEDLFDGCTVLQVGGSTLTLIERGILLLCLTFESISIVAYTQHLDWTERSAISIHHCQMVDVHQFLTKLNCLDSLLR